MATATSARTDLQPLVAAQGATRDELTTQAILIAAASARSFDGWYDSVAITKWADTLAKAIEPILRLLARNTDAYAARSVSGVAGRSFRPVGAIDVANLRRDITHAGAFARAANAYRFQQYVIDQTAKVLNERVTVIDGLLVIGEGADLDGNDLGELSQPDVVDPIDVAVQRVADVADLDISLVVQQQAHATFTAAERRGLITGWRRVIHPELSEGGTCGLCVAASTQIYRVEDLMPIHGRCKCVPAPICGKDDPGHILNEGDLERLYEDAGSTSTADLKRTRYRVDEHGNLGPVLTSADSPKRAARKAKANEIDRPEKTPEQKRADLEKYRDQMAAALPKAKALADADPKKWGDYHQKLEARVADLDRQLA